MTMVSQSAVSFPDSDPGNGKSAGYIGTAGNTGNKGVVSIGLSRNYINVDTIPSNQTPSNQTPLSGFAVKKPVTAHTLGIDGCGMHAKAFNELIRRIKPEKQVEIAGQLNRVYEHELETLDSLLDDPSKLTGNDFFCSGDFPYIALRAFRDERINLNEFSTLVSLQAITMNGQENDPDFTIKYISLFDSAGNPIESSWNIVKATLEKSKSDNGEEGTKSLYGFFDVDLIISRMKTKMRGAPAIESGFWYFTHNENLYGGMKTVADTIRANTTCMLSTFLSEDGSSKLDMVPTLSLRQTFIECAFNEFSADGSCKNRKAHRLNPVIGISSVDDISIGGRNRYRDYALPFPGHPLPKTADDFPAPFITDFQHHDFYHACRASLLSYEEVDFYLDIGDALLELRNQFNNDLPEVIKLVEKKYRIGLDALRQIEKTAPEKLGEAEELLKETTMKNLKLIWCFKNRRKAIGQRKANLYDMEVSHAKVIKNLYKKIIRTTGEQIHLSGKAMELAGRAALPVMVKKDTQDLRQYYQSLNNDKEEGLKAYKAYSEIFDGDVCSCKEFIGDIEERLSFYKAVVREPT